MHLHMHFQTYTSACTHIYPHTCTHRCIHTLALMQSPTHKNQTHIHSTHSHVHPTHGSLLGLCSHVFLLQDFGLVRKGGRGKRPFLLFGLIPNSRGIFSCVFGILQCTLSRWNLGTKRTSRVWVTVRNLKGAMCPILHPLDWCWIPRPCCYRSHFSLRSRCDTWCESHSNGE